MSMEADTTRVVHLLGKDHRPGLLYTTEAKTDAFLSAMPSDEETTGPISPGPDSTLVHKLKKVTAV